MNPEPRSSPVVHNQASSRFEIVEGSHTAVLEYRISHGALVLTHTGVPQEIEGMGVGGALVKAAFEYARSHGLKVRPLCPFVKKYLERHPEYAELVA